MSLKENVSVAYVIDAVYDDVPEYIAYAIRQLWIANELGNDYYYYTINMEDADAEIYDANLDKILQWLRGEGFTKDDDVLLHYWW